jgi:Protein of unknown function (DUF1515)
MNTEMENRLSDRELLITLLSEMKHLRLDLEKSEKRFDEERLLNEKRYNEIEVRLDSLEQSRSKALVYISVVGVVLSAIWTATQYFIAKILQ